MIARRIALAAALAAGISASGCVTAQFRVAVEDHYIQAATILRWCQDGVYAQPCDAQLIEDLEAMSLQAQHIVEYTKVTERD